jgi:hypothetical protein
VFPSPIPVHGADTEGRKLTVMSTPPEPEIIHTDHVTVTATFSIKLLGSQRG